jgi:hypothetical protein
MTSVDMVDAYMKAKHPGFRKIALSARIDLDPKSAKEEILAAYRIAGASLTAAAAVLGLQRRTLYRYVVRLELEDALKQMTGKAQREGWLNKNRKPVTK